MKSGVEERSTSHITSVTTIVKDSSVSHVSDRPGEGGEEEEEEEDPAAPQSLDIVLPAGLFVITHEPSVLPDFALLTSLMFHYKRYCERVLTNFSESRSLYVTR